MSKFNLNGYTKRARESVEALRAGVLTFTALVREGVNGSDPLAALGVVAALVTIEQTAKMPDGKQDRARVMLGRNMVKLARHPLGEFNRAALKAAAVGADYTTLTLASKGGVCEVIQTTQAKQAQAEKVDPAPAESIDAAEVATLREQAAAGAIAAGEVATLRAQVAALSAALDRASGEGAAAAVLATLGAPKGRKGGRKVGAPAAVAQAASA